MTVDMVSHDIHTHNPMHYVSTVHKDYGSYDLVYMLNSVKGAPALQNILHIKMSIQSNSVIQTSVHISIIWTLSCMPSNVLVHMHTGRDRLWVWSIA